MAAAETAGQGRTERPTDSFRLRLFGVVSCLMGLVFVPTLYSVQTPAAAVAWLLYFCLCLVVALFAVHFVCAPILVLKRRLQVRNYGETGLVQVQGREAHSGPINLLGRLEKLFPVADQPFMGRLPRELSEIERLARAGMVTEIAINQARTDLFHHLSHNLKTPLARVQHLCLLTRKAVQSGDSAGVLEQMGAVDSECLHMGRLIDQLLRMAYVEQKAEQGLSEAVHNLTKIVHTVAKVLRMDADAKDIDLQITCEPGLFIRGERDLLVEMLSTLIDNAIRYSPAGSDVRVEVGRVMGSQKVAQVLITDRGPGIPAHARGQVFEPFVGSTGSDPGGRAMFGTRMHRALPDGQKSHGLGLAIARSIVRLQGGSIELDDPADQTSGLLVRVILPLTTQPREVLPDLEG